MREAAVAASLIIHICLQFNIMQRSLFVAEGFGEGLRGDAGVA